jgi:hypothetical protein
MGSDSATVSESSGILRYRRRVAYLLHPLPPMRPDLPCDSVGWPARLRDHHPRKLRL